MAGYHSINIEPSAFHKGQYVGYGGGSVWRIVRFCDGWGATAPANEGRAPLYAARLSGLSYQLSLLPTPAATQE